MMRQISDVLPELRKKHGLRQKAMAGALRCRPETLCRIENGRRGLLNNGWWPQRFAALISLGIPKDDALLIELRSIVQTVAANIDLDELPAGEDRRAHRASQTEKGGKMKQPTTAFGAYLLNWRKQRNLTQAEMVEHLGLPVSQASISAWEIGRQIPSPKHFAIIAAKLDISVEALADLTGSKNIKVLPPGEKDLAMRLVANNPLVSEADLQSLVDMAKALGRPLRVCQLLTLLHLRIKEEPL